MKLKKLKKIKGDTSETPIKEENGSEKVISEETKKNEIEKKDEVKKGNIAEAISEDILEMIESSDAPAKEPEGSVLEDEIECPECGEKLPATSRSCLNCGALLEIEEVEIPIEDTPSTKANNTSPSVADEEHIDITAPVQQLATPVTKKILKTKKIEVVERN
jgi:DNA-directed RNA polymerase subunit M/transcription elongation factor TFIIS